MSDDLSVTRVLATAAAKLEAVSASARLDAELLLGRACTLTRAQLLARGPDALSTPSLAVFDALLARRERGEPLAYILGVKDFWSLTLEVTPAVLVPRPETELLVELAIAAGDALVAEGRSVDASQIARVPSVVDLGTGSGAIALAIAAERPLWSITASDLSASALDVARRNARRNRLEAVEFVQGDWLLPHAGRVFDIVVSNPPYLAADDPALHDLALACEPVNALTDHANGMSHLESIARAARDSLAHGGTLLLEHAPAQATALRAELVALGYGHVRSHRDLAGRERATEARNLNLTRIREGHYGSL